MNFELAFGLLGAEEPLRKKRGIQLFCEHLEAQKTIPTKYHTRLLRSLSELKKCHNINVKRWFFKLVGLIGEVNLLPYIIGDVQSGSLDQETTSWAVASMAGLIPNEHELNKIKYSLDGLLSEDQFLLATAYFQKRPISEERCVNIFQSGDPLIGKWLCLHFGYNITPAPKHMIIEYNLHPNKYLAEYSLWALWKHYTGSFQDVKIPPQNIHQYPDNVRRWYFMLMLKEEKNFLIFRDIILETINFESSYAVRESIAKSIKNIHPDADFARIISDWFDNEKDETVRQHLFAHISRNVGNHECYTEQFNHLISCNTQSLPRTRGIGAPIYEDNNPTGNVMMIPRIKYKKSQMTYFLGIDTVDFSSKKNEDQIQILSDILEMFRSISESHNSPNVTGQAATILTGDGLFLAFTGDANIYQPLEIALEAQKRMNKLRSYKIRFGINSGVAYWVSLDI